MCGKNSGKYKLIHIWHFSACDITGKSFCMTSGAEQFYCPFEE